jgi:hypothetical protein
MSYIYFAVVAEGEVFNVLGFDEDNSIAEKWIAAFRSNVDVINVNEYKKIRKGYLYKDGNFYGPEDMDFLNPISKEEPDDSVSLNFAGVIENEVIGLITFVKEDMADGYYELIKAGMSSNPTYHEVPVEVSEGWLFDGTTFTPGD